MKLLQELAMLAWRAGSVIMDVYGSDFPVTVKADSSPVTAADQAAEDVILTGLAQLAPGTPVVAEEATASGIVPELAERFFLVDPLDGTKEFVSRNGEFTVNIALVERGEPVLGVVYAPALGRLFLGERSGGAFQAETTADGLGPLRDTRVRPAPERLVVVGSRSHGNPQTDALLARLPVDRYSQAGSSLKFCLVAEGTADVYPRLGPTMEWDTAAGDAILRAAGGIVVTSDGRPMTYGHIERGFRNPGFMALGDGRVLETILANG